MATKKTSKSKVVTAETRESANPGPKPQHRVVEERLHWQAKNGDEIILDLDFPSDILRSVMLDELDETEQFAKMLEALGDGALQERINRMGALEYMRLITTFFKEFQDLSGATVGESEGSSDSSTSTE